MKKAYKTAADKLKGSFTLVDTIKSDLRAEIERINADMWTSDSRKEQLRNEAMNAARSKLESVRATADAAAVELDAVANALINRFDYNDQNLIGAVNFINAFGKDVPAEAADQIISDYKNQPAALKLLKKAFDRSSLGVASIKTMEELTRFEGLATLSQRASDSVYFATTGDIQTPANFSVFIAEIDGTAAALGVEGE